MKSERKLTVVYGGQFGSEGKGQIANYIAENEPVDFAVRVGGPNAGHTFYYGPQKTKVVVQSIPTPVYQGATGVIGCGGILILDLLEQELKNAYEVLGKPVNLLIDGMATVISAEMMVAEADLKKNIASTGEGVGAAGAAKIWRKKGILVRNHTPFFLRLTKTPHGSMVRVVEGTHEFLNNPNLSAHVLVEGTQGVGLSLHTSGFYPYCTSRECTPQGIIAEAGLNPYSFDSYERIAVIRTYPIRVGGPSGPLAGEVAWKDIPGAPTPEKTTVTKTTRRIAKIQEGDTRKMISLTSPTKVAVSFLDYVFPELANVSDWDTIRNHPGAVEYAFWVLQDMAPLGYISTGPGVTLEI